MSFERRLVTSQFSTAFNGCGCIAWKRDYKYLNVVLWVKNLFFSKLVLPKDSEPAAGFKSEVIIRLLALFERVTGFLNKAIKNH